MEKTSATNISEFQRVRLCLNDPDRAGHYSGREHVKVSPRDQEGPDEIVAFTLVLLNMEVIGDTFQPSSTIEVGLALRDAVASMLKETFSAIFLFNCSSQELRMRALGIRSKLRIPRHGTFGPVSVLITAATQ